MIILKKNNHIDETKLNRNETIVFIALLKHELNRHRYEVYRAKEQMYYDVGYINSIFWKCQMENHLQDLNKIQICINYLVQKWGLL